MALGAASLASIFTFFASESQAISLQLWIAGFVVVFAYRMFQRFGDVTSISRPRRLGLAQLRRVSEDEGAPSAKRERTLQAIVLRSRDNERVFASRLRPQLVELTEHFLPLNHGVDPVGDRQRTHEVLGDVAWLIDPAVVNRRPTIDELDRFVGIVLNEESTHSRPTTSLEGSTAQ